jgi:hypothetical protein
VNVPGDLLGRWTEPDTRSPTARRRPWTRSATAAAGAHVFYELLAGVAMPFTSRWGPGTAATFWAANTVAA